MRPVATTISQTWGHSARNRTVWLDGTNLGNTRRVLLSGQAAEALVIESPTRLRFRMPTAPNFQPGAVKVALVSSIDGTTVPTKLEFTYQALDKVDRQMDYAFDNWNNSSSKRFGYLSGNDCANFTSQTLLARGWKRSSEWFNSGQGDWSSTWVSSTALSSWLATRPQLATRLLYRDRDLAKVGDVIQFNYEGHAKWWDHSGVVSKVVTLPDGRHDIYYVAHTLNRQYGGSTEMLAKYSGPLRIQFWHLNK